MKKMRKPPKRRSTEAAFVTHIHQRIVPPKKGRKAPYNRAKERSRAQVQKEETT